MTKLLSNEKQMPIHYNQQHTGHNVTRYYKNLSTETCKTALLSSNQLYHCQLCVHCRYSNIWQENHIYLHND